MLIVFSLFSCLTLESLHESEPSEDEKVVSTFKFVQRSATNGDWESALTRISPKLRSSWLYTMVYYGVSGVPSQKLQDKFDALIRECMIDVEQIKERLEGQPNTCPIEKTLLIDQFIQEFIEAIEKPRKFLSDALAIFDSELKFSRYYEGELSGIKTDKDTAFATITPPSSFHSEPKRIYFRKLHSNWKICTKNEWASKQASKD